MSAWDNSRTLIAWLVAAAIVAPPAAPQDSSAAHDAVQDAMRSAAHDTLPTISPGMTREQVVDHLGWPVAERDELVHSYYFYDPACSQPGCAPNDVVIFRHDSVEDALFHSGLRRYTGQARQVVLPPVVRPRGSSGVPSAIKAASAGDSSRRGGVVFVGPRPIGRPTSQYQTIQPSAAPPPAAAKARVHPRAPVSASPPDSTAPPDSTPATRPGPPPSSP